MGMRVQIRYTVDVDDDIRRAINDRYGRPGLATRAEVQRWYESNGRSADDDLRLALELAEADEIEGGA